MRNVSDKRTENQNTLLYSVNFFFRKSCRRWNNVEKYCTAGQATDDNMAHVHCMLDTYGSKHTHTHTHTLRMCNTYCCVLLQKRASLLRYTYITYLVTLCCVFLNLRKVSKGSTKMLVAIILRRFNSTMRGSFGLFNIILPFTPSFQA